MNELLHNKWVLIGGVSVVAIVAYFYFGSGSADGASQDGGNGMLVPSGSFAPIGTTNAGVVSASMPGSTSSSSSDPNAYLEALSNLQAHSDELNANVALASINAQQTIALAQNDSNYNLGVQAIGAQNAMTAASLFSSLFKTVGKKGQVGAFGDLSIDPLTGSISVYGGGLFGATKKNPNPNGAYQTGYDDNGAPIANLGNGTSIMLGGFGGGNVATPANTTANTAGFKQAPGSGGGSGRPGVSVAAQ